MFDAIALVPPPATIKGHIYHLSPVLSSWLHVTPVHLALRDERLAAGPQLDAVLVVHQPDKLLRGRGSLGRSSDRPGMRWRVHPERVGAEGAPFGRSGGGAESAQSGKDDQTFLFQFVRPFMNNSSQNWLKSPLALSKFKPRMALAAAVSFCIGLICLTAGSSYGASIRCTFDGVQIPVNDTYTYLQGCHEITCVCDPNLQQMCKSVPKGCLHPLGTCVDENARYEMNTTRGVHECICRREIDGKSLVGTECTIKRCLDVDGTYKSVGERVTVSLSGTLFECTCGGRMDYCNCSTLESIRNADKCLDVNGHYIQSGHRVVTQSENGEFLICTCRGSSGYSDCMTQAEYDHQDMCQGKDHQWVTKGSELRIEFQGDDYICRCNGTNKHAGCRLADEDANKYRGRCQDYHGRLVKAGGYVRILRGGAVFVCHCTGTNTHEGCLTEQAFSHRDDCIDLSGGYVKRGRLVRILNNENVIVCTCKGSSGYSDCQSEQDYSTRNQCKGADGKFVSKGRKVRIVSEGISYVCHCAGAAGYKNCLTEEAYMNKGKCKDVNGQYVDRGKEVVVFHHSILYQCKCIGTNRYQQCKDYNAIVNADKCKNYNDTYVEAGQIVVIKSSTNTTFYCECMGSQGYKNCLTKEIFDNINRCQSANGSYVEIGEVVEYKVSGTIYVCECNGTNKYKDCVSKDAYLNRDRCRDVDGKYVGRGEAVRVLSGTEVYICQCHGSKGIAECMSNETYYHRGMCKDLEGNFLPKGEKISIEQNEIIYVCDCIGNNTYKNCKTIEAFQNAGRCKGHNGSYTDIGEPDVFNNRGKCRDRDGDYVEPGKKVRIRHGKRRYVCDCEGENLYKQCVTEDQFENRENCIGSDGEYVLLDEKVKVEVEQESYVCTCKGAMGYSDCVSEESLLHKDQCKDAVSKNYSKRGEKVRVRCEKQSIIFICECAGSNQYRNCVTELSVKNQGKCKDKNGTFVPQGQLVRHIVSETLYVCNCGGTNRYLDCMTETQYNNRHKCRGMDENYVEEGQMVVVKSGADVFVCICNGSDGVRNCVTNETYHNRDKCRDLHGNYVGKGEKVSIERENQIYVCNCGGNNAYKNCQTLEAFENNGRCKGYNESYVDAGEPVVVKQDQYTYVCICNGTNKFVQCMQEEVWRNKNKCRDIDGSYVEEDDRVNYRYNNQIYVCRCKGTNRYADCVTKEAFENQGKCRASDGSYAAPGQTVRVEHGGKAYICLCEGHNQYGKCMTEETYANRERCKGSDGIYVDKGQKVKVNVEHLVYVCVCKGQMGYSDCVTEESLMHQDQCKDVVSGEFISKGDNVRIRCDQKSAVFVCECIGTDQYRGCVTEESIKNRGKCKDDNGTYVSQGQNVARTADGKTYICVCQGTNNYGNCMTEEDYVNRDKCKDHRSGRYIDYGDTVTVLYAGKVWICVCAKGPQYTQCQPEATEEDSNTSGCKDKHGNWIKAGDYYQIMSRGVAYSCRCKGNNVAVDCESSTLFLPACPSRGGNSPASQILAPVAGQIMRRPLFQAVNSVERGKHLGVSFITRRKNRPGSSVPVIYRGAGIRCGICRLTQQQPLRSLATEGRRRRSPWQPTHQRGAPSDSQGKVVAARAGWSGSGWSRVVALYLLMLTQGDDVGVLMKIAMCQHNETSLTQQLYETAKFGNGFILGSNWPKHGAGYQSAKPGGRTEQGLERVQHSWFGEQAGEQPHLHLILTQGSVHKLRDRTELVADGGNSQARSARNSSGSARRTVATSTSWSNFCSAASFSLDSAVPGKCSSRILRQCRSRLRNCEQLELKLRRSLRMVALRRVNRHSSAESDGGNNANLTCCSAIAKATGFPSASSGDLAIFELKKLMAFSKEALNSSTSWLQLEDSESSAGIAAQADQADGGWRVAAAVGAQTEKFCKAAGQDLQIGVRNVLCVQQDYDDSAGTALVGLKSWLMSLSCRTCEDAEQILRRLRRRFAAVASTIGASDSADTGDESARAGLPAELRGLEHCLSVELTAAMQKYQSGEIPAGGSLLDSPGRLSRLNCARARRSQFAAAAASASSFSAESPVSAPGLLSALPDSTYSLLCSVSDLLINLWLSAANQHEGPRAVWTSSRRWYLRCLADAGVASSSNGLDGQSSVVETASGDKDMRQFVRLALARYLDALEANTKVSRKRSAPASISSCSGSETEDRRQQQQKSEEVLYPASGLFCRNIVIDLGADRNASLLATDPTPDTRKADEQAEADRPEPDSQQDFTEACETVDPSCIEQNSGAVQDDEEDDSCSIDLDNLEVVDDLVNDCALSLVGPEHVIGGEDSNGAVDKDASNGEACILLEQPSSSECPDPLMRLDTTDPSQEYTVPAALADAYSRLSTVIAACSVGVADLSTSNPQSGSAAPADSREFVPYAGAAVVSPSQCGLCRKYASVQPVGDTKARRRQLRPLLPRPPRPPPPPLPPSSNEMIDLDVSRSLKLLIRFESRLDSDPPPPPPSISSFPPPPPPPPPAPTIATNDSVGASICTNDYSVGASISTNDYTVGASISTKDYSAGASISTKDYSAGASISTNDYTVGTSGSTSDYSVGASISTNDYSAGASISTNDYTVGTSGSTSDYTVGTSGSTSDYSVGASISTNDYSAGASISTNDYTVRTSGSTSDYSVGASISTNDYSVGASGSTNDHSPRRVSTSSEADTFVADQSIQDVTQSMESLIAGELSSVESELASVIARGESLLLQQPSFGPTWPESPPESSNVFPAVDTVVGQAVGLLASDLAKTEEDSNSSSRARMIDSSNQRQSLVAKRIGGLRTLSQFTQSAVGSKRNCWPTTSAKTTAATGGQASEQVSSSGGGGDEPAAEVVVPEAGDANDFDNGNSRSLGLKWRPIMFSWAKSASSAAAKQRRLAPAATASPVGESGDAGEPEAVIDPARLSLMSRGSWRRFSDRLRVLP
uniref:EGF-like domain-containing protein n=2 Tax=Macrostomum lignano TaxID=282301 RepID=A0A1I8HF06_9PLAT